MNDNRRTPAQSRPEDAVLPESLRPVAAGAAVDVVWRNELGGLTFELDGADGRRFVKWAPVGSGLDLTAEIARLRWLTGRTPAPRVLSTGADDFGAWMVTSPVPGESAVSDRWRAQPAGAVAAIGAGLRALHDALPVDDCPFDWSTDVRLNVVRRRAADGDLDPRAWHREHRHLSVPDAVERVGTPPPIDRLVVCHGDACAPNTLLTDNGTWSGHVDLGALGVADRWADLAVATWSTEWNYGRGWDDLLLASYGIAPDAERVAYYRLLWDLT
jgi:kanamycin kinase